MSVSARAECALAGMERRNELTRTRTLTGALAAFALLLLASASVPAQNSAPEKQAQAKAGAQTVLLNVIVTDSRGHTVADVKREDLRLYVDGAEQPITYFSNEVRPVSYGLVVDNSGSLRDQINHVVAAAKIIVNSNTTEDETFVVRFISADNIKLMEGLTADKAALSKALDAMYVEGGQTAVIDAVYLSANNLLNKGKPAGDKPRRHALVLISDGEDRASYYKIDDLYKLLRKSDIQIFCIGLTASLDKERGFTTQSKREKAIDLLKHLASVTGGRVYFAEKVGELKDAIAEVINDLHTQYVVGYVPAATAGSGSNHKVEIRVVDAPGRGKLKVVTKPEITLDG